jgi:DNA-directed RNA polymerase beta' subunit
MEALGVPSGDKVRSDRTVPGWITNGPRAVKRAFLSAYFGAELSTPGYRGHKLFRQPVFKLSRTEDVLDAGEEFVDQIDGLLREFGSAVANVRISAGNQRADGTTSQQITAELAASNDALRALFGRIGYTYNKSADSEARLAYGYLTEKPDEKPAIERFPEYESWKDDRVANEREGLIRDEIVAIDDAEDQRVYDVTTEDEAHKFISNQLVSNNCPPYNADFDGDEMNMHALQNEEARAEARVLMRVQEQILSPKMGENIIGAIQDHITGTYLLTNENPQFNETQALDLLRATQIDELPDPSGTDDGGDPYWTGRDIFSELLPDGLNLEFHSSAGDVVGIEDGVLVQGTVDEDAVGAFGGEIVDTITKVYGKTRARRFINEVGALAMRSIMHFGFSIAIDDETVDEETQGRIDEAIDNAYERVEELIRTYENGDLESLPGRTVDETLEMKIMQTLGKARDNAGDIAEEHFSDDNPAVVMAESGARGSMLNLTQMAGCVGQQAVRGERINRGYEDRTLSHYEPDDLSAEAHGFVEHSYAGGLTPREFFFHAMGGREGLVDTAVRTSKSGYLQRRLINALSELETQYDGTVRDTSDTIVQFEFGEDGTSPVKVSSDEDDPIKVDQIADRVIEEEFSSEEEKAQFLGESRPPTNLSEHGDTWRIGEMAEWEPPEEPDEPLPPGTGTDPEGEPEPEPEPEAAGGGAEVSEDD